MEHAAVRLMGRFRTQVLGTLHDTQTATRFVLEVVKLSGSPPIGRFAVDVASSLEGYGKVPTREERGVLAACYASLAHVLVRTYPALGVGRIELSSYAEPYIEADILALIDRHYATRDAALVDVTHEVGQWP